MRKLVVDTSEDPISSNVVQVLQLRTVNDPWLSMLETFECERATEAFTPFIHLFLSPKTAGIKLGFAEDTPIIAVASMISRLSALCPNLEHITLNDLPRDPIITEAVSEMVLACNRDALQNFRVDSPLTEEAREVVYRLPRLSRLWAIIQGPTWLPAVSLPNLTGIYVEYDGDLNWLQGFRGGTLEKLEVVAFRSESEQIGNFLGAFESVVLTTSAQNTLSDFGFYTPRSWNPNYSSLHSFKQLKRVVTEFSCEGGCSSRVDDDIVINLAQAMPKLEVLLLGKAPCATRTGVTFNGLIGLACRCPHLSELCIHFQAANLVEAAASATMPPPSDEPVVWREDCALVDLEVGETPIPAQSVLTVAHILLQIFPRLLNVEYTNEEWATVAETIKDFRRIGASVRRTGKAAPITL